MITIALPSKGRLKEQAIEALAKAGLIVEEFGNDRRYQARIKGRDDIAIAYLSASEISRELGNGGVDLGITGEDLIRENVRSWRKYIAIETRLGFGGADVIVACPDSWLDVRTMDDLHDVASHFRAVHGRRLRIATKYWQLTQEFFSEKHGIQTYRIVESLGATEGSPATGAADVIVDITSTGSTLKANHLRVLDDGVILKSEAVMARSLKTHAPELCDGIIAALNKAHP